MDPQELAAQRDRVQLLDVREPEEWVAGHIEGALHIPMSVLNARIQEIARDRTVVCVCRVGSRSQAVADALNRAGFQAANLDGGMAAWESAGLPFVAEDDGPPRVA